MKRAVTTLVLSISVAAPVFAANGGQLGRIGGALKKVEQVRELQITDAEEQQLGATVSQRVRDRYGVVQDATVQRYVALVGHVLAQGSTRPALPWTFIVLDTDAVNAFAAPGGFVHITRGALALIQDESELAAVLGHEIVHVAEQHTMKSIRNTKAIQMGADETLSGSAALLNRLAERVYSDIIDNSFGRAEENESDEKGVGLAHRLGYAPQGLTRFLTRLQERNEGSKEKRGLFASHPAMAERLDRLAKQIASQKLMASATLGDRYKQHIFYLPVPLSGIAVIAEGAAGLAGDGREEKPAAKSEEKKADPPKRSRFGSIGKMLPSGGGEKQSAQVTASAAARGVDPERDAKGGPNPNPVAVTVTAADIAAFKKEGRLA